jgi:sugar lactone lactonase YvrE
MNEPIGLAVDKDGNVYVADSHNTRIQKFDKDGKFVAKWAIPAGAWDPGPFVEPFLALDGAGNVYSTAPTSKAVIKFSPTGEVLGQKNSDGKNTLQLPTGITVDPDGTVYVVDTNGNGVVKLGTIP